MELPELEQGLQNIQQENQTSAPASAPWLTMDNLMQDYGNWFGNDKGLGEMLLGQLRAHNVDTQAATEAMLRKLLQGLVDDLTVLQERLMGFVQATSQQLQSTQAVADSIQTALVQSGASPEATTIMPPEMSNPAIEVPPEAAQSEVPPEATQSEATQSEVPPEATQSEVPPEAAQSEVPPEATQSEVPPEPTGTPSDINIKKIYTLSDASMKKLVGKMKARRQSKIANNILAACQGGY
jgi:hypothetical protein